MAGKDTPTRRPVGIREIAERAKVSKTAVSYALNDTGRLDDATRKRILKIAKEMGYRANPHARNLRKRSAGVIAISASLTTVMSESLPNMDYFMRIWNASVTTALERGYMLLLAPFGTEPATLRNVPIDGGIVLDPLADDPVLRYYEAHHLPVVTIGRDLKKAGDQWWVDSPHAPLATEIFGHFRDQGAKRIGLVLFSQKYAYNFDVRRAYIDWIAATDGEPLIVEISDDPTETAGYEAARKLLSLDHPPEAIYASLDRLAVGASFAAEKHALDIPGKLLLAAGSDGTITRQARTPITALNLYPERLGHEAVAMLIDRIEQNIEPRQLMVPGNIQVRASTDRGNTSSGAR